MKSSSFRTGRSMSDVFKTVRLNTEHLDLESESSFSPEMTQPTAEVI